MRYAIVLGGLTSLAALASAQQTVTVSASKTDIGSILKSMDQSKLAQFPKDARAVMVKMPETPDAVTPADRAAIKACMGKADLDALAKEACTAQNDQLSAILDKQRVGPESMAKFVTSAMAAGAKPPVAT